MKINPAIQERRRRLGRKIIELRKTNDISRARDATSGEEQQPASVVLTKKPSGTLDVRVSISNTRNLKIVNPKITFTPENWHILKEIKAESCANKSIKLTFTAKAGKQGGLKKEG